MLAHIGVKLALTKLMKMVEVLTAVCPYLDRNLQMSMNVQNESQLEVIPNLLQLSWLATS